MPKPILVSGIKPEGHIHLGNYLGSLKNFVALQQSKKYDCHFFIADLHSLTEDFDPKLKYNQILELAAEYIALGLDPKKSTIFLQSAIPAHTELMWLLTVITPEGELRRMTQYKDKVLVKNQDANIGLLMYPALMAADILLYNAKFVPVGEDQIQHLELTRTLARKFNSKFGQTFIEPQPILTKAKRVMSLGDPKKKMSKSQPETCLFLDDSPEVIKHKVMRAVTDSGSEIKFDWENKPGISNLLEIYSEISGKTIDQLEKAYAGKRYSDLKSDIAEAISNHLEDYRNKKKVLLKNKKQLKTILDSGSKKASVIANKKIMEVKKKVGLII